MSDKNPQICTPKDAKAAAQHLEDARLHVVSTFIPTGSPYGIPGDLYNKFICFEMFNGSIANAALVARVIRFNPSSWRQILTADITRQAPTQGAAMHAMRAIFEKSEVPTVRIF